MHVKKVRVKKKPGTIDKSSYEYALYEISHIENQCAYGRSCNCKICLETFGRPFKTSRQVLRENLQGSALIVIVLSIPAIVFAIASCFR